MKQLVDLVGATQATFIFVRWECLAGDPAADSVNIFANDQAEELSAEDACEKTGDVRNADL